MFPTTRRCRMRSSTSCPWRSWRCAPQAGKEPRMIHWGSYAEDRPKLPDHQARAVKDFEYYSQTFVRLLSNRELLAKEKKEMALFAAATSGVDRDRAKNEMGAWLADYLDDAGYIGWEMHASIYKAMIMTAFPPIDALDGVKPEYHTMSLETFEDNMTRVLEVMDSHLAEQRRLRSLDSGSITGLLRRARLESSAFPSLTLEWLFSLYACEGSFFNSVPPPVLRWKLARNLYVFEAEFDVAFSVQIWRIKEEHGSVQVVTDNVRNRQSTAQDAASIGRLRQKAILPDSPGPKDGRGAPTIASGRNRRGKDHHVQGSRAASRHLDKEAAK
ncbi:unnamed protein product, partial [Symbiodinium microadriaticum]